MRNREKYEGKSLPKPKLVKLIGDKILSPEEPNCIRYKLNGSDRAPHQNIFYLARHEDVMDIMKGKHVDKVDLSQFDEGLTSGVGDERFFLGAKSDQKQQQWDILRAALSFSPKITRQNTGESFKSMAEEASQNALNDIRRRHENIGLWEKIRIAIGRPAKPIEFNAVKEFGYVVPYLVMSQFIGLQMPKRKTWHLKLLTSIRNMLRPGTVSLKSETIRPAMQMLTWVLFIFGHLFANIGGRNSILQRLSIWASKRFRSQIDFSYHREDLPYGCLLHRLKTVKATHFPNISEAEYLRHVRGIVLEFAGAGQMLTGISFAKILGSLHDNNVSIDKFVTAFKDGNDDIIDEALRMDTTTQTVFRVAKETIHIGGETIVPGDMICLLIDRACKDESAFANPDIFSDFTNGAPQRLSKNYLTFGPHENGKPNDFQPPNNVHPCFGQYWARCILKAMFEGLQKMPDIGFKNSNKPIFKDFSGVPDTGLLIYERPKAESPQTLVTICSEINIPFKNSEEATVQKLLEKLGNPASLELSQELKTIDSLHFISMHIIEGVGSGEPDYLLLEMSADGTESEAIDTICGNAYFQKKILAIYRAAGCVREEKDLRRHLADHSVELKQSLWPRFFSGRWTNGLGFSGTSGLTLKRIKAEYIIAEHARGLLNVTQLGTGFEGPPHKLLKQVRHHILTDSTDPTLAESRWVLQNSEPPQFSETRDSAWNKTWGKLEEITRLFPFSFMFLLVAIGAVLWSAIWEVLFGDGINKVDLLTKAGISFDNLSKPDIIAPYVYLSAMPLISNCIIAFIFTLLISAFRGAKIRNKKPIKYRQMGHMFWFLGCFLFLQFVTIYFNYIVHFLKKTGLVGDHSNGSLILQEPKLDLIAARMSDNIQTLMIAAFIALIILFLCKNTVGKKSVNRGLDPYFLFFLIVLLFGTVVIKQITNFTLSQTLWSGQTPPVKESMLNKFENAKLSVILLQPFLTSLILTGSIFAFNANYADYQISFLKKPVHYYLLGLLFFLLIFYTSFFSFPDNPMVLFKHAIIAIIMLWVIPALLAAIICLVIFRFTSTLAGKKQDQTVFVHWYLWLIAISVFLNLTSQPRGYITDCIAKYFNLNVQKNQLLSFREKMAEMFFAFGITLPVLLLIGGLIIVVLGHFLSSSEANNTPHDSDAMISNIEKMMMNENKPGYVQNHMLSVTRLIPEHFRHSITLPLALSIMVTATKKQRARPGFLGTIGTVHFARWIHLPRTNNYVFASNYDGSFESYLEDFITKFGEPLNGAWSHGIGYPKTKDVFYEGSHDGERFIRWARGSMRPTPFWYSAYPTLSVEQIRRNALIRDGLARIESSSDAEAWLDLFDSVTRPDHALQTDQIQSLVFGGAKKLKFGCCLVVERKTEEDEKCKEPGVNKWLRDVREDITFGDLAPQDVISYLALSKDGLSQAGFSKDLDPHLPWKGDKELTTEQDPIKFSSAFALGMNNESRASILGDLDKKNKAEKWDWGRQDNPALAVILVYANTEKALKASIDGHKEKLLDNDLISREINFKDPDKPEPFGFKDGISNPILRGTIQAARNSESIHLVNPGEFILGYKDNRGYFPSSPQIESIRDRDDILPAIPKSLPQKYPKFLDGKSDTLRDLGRNGSYLVIRQLEQNVTAFNKATKSIAKNLFPSEFKSNSKTRQKNATLATQAKLMGRWQDGRPLVTAPVKVVPTSNGNKRLVSSGAYPKGTNIEEAQRRDNEFLYGRDDPQGHACPFGSHIRRTFPRDSLNPGEESELEISNRHRLLRRGRSYEEVKSNKKTAEGTFFMCLNANIQRQFEFVQQTWVQGSTFHGLRDEVDPITAQRSGSDQSFTFQCPGRDDQISSLQSFVSMKGGGYFFMPGRDALEFISKHET